MKMHITFESDWHVGEGAGATGHIDRVVRRHPEDNLPYVPAKTLTGILRDACEKVARGLDDGADDGSWQRFVATLFGRQSQDRSDGSPANATTTSALVSIGAARFASDLRRALRRNPDIAEALCFVKPGVALDADGVAKSKMLRFEEMVLAGAELEAQLDLAQGIDDQDAAVRNAVLAILAAGARAAERLGAKRRRGNGRCRITLPHLEFDLAGILGGDPPEFPAVGASGIRLSTPTIGDNPGWHVIPLNLALLSPVAVPAGTAGNVIATEDYIPGSLLLPALDRQLRDMLGARRDELTAHLAAGRIQVRNAYPMENGLRLLPAPAALMAMKDRPGSLRNELHDAGDDGVQRKQLRNGYLPATFLPVAGESKSPVASVPTIATTHAVVEDARQRPTADVGGIYTYEAIAPGRTFRAELWIAKSVLADAPDTASLARGIRVGRAKKDDYGQVAVTTEKAGDPPANRNETTEITIWLVSPLLLRDQRLRPVVTAEEFAKWLKTQPGMAGLDLKKSFVRSQRNDGWNSAWREPRPTHFGLAAGSCFLFSAQQPIAGAALARLEAEGLGERRGEGYGEIRVNAPLLLAAIPTGAWGDPKPEQPDIAIDPTPFTRQLHERAWRIAIRRRALDQASTVSSQDLRWTRNKPGNSQLGALRGQFEQWTGPGRLASWLGHLRQTANRRDKWPQESLVILDQCAARESDIWSRIDAETLPLLPGHDRESLKRSLAAEATRIYWLTTIAVELDRQAAIDAKELGGN